jgi:hypothetical protein
MGRGRGLEGRRRKTAVKKVSTIRAALIVMALGCFISAQQARSETVFQAESARSLARLVIGAPALGTTPEGASGPVSLGGASSPAYALAATDSTQTVDIEVPEAKPHHHYKEIVGITIVAAVVAYAAITMFTPDKGDLKPANNNGKPTPFGTAVIGFAVPLSR